ncbi:uncharacterized protein LOC128988744 isoform X1 [Macrosteles quadrilineatus]|uniref:uncharacterized protein LOC128988744 isoform X1 n=1 Tax=Macrosteles quadrilineatus TaxID=74068 RepID=UPI0023E11F23|nr:uncharacterized protein LOC128988744 isoform X1 [Macrosteles quadrilineatus]
MSLVSVSVVFFYSCFCDCAALPSSDPAFPRILVASPVRACPGGMMRDPGGDCRAVVGGEDDEIWTVSPGVTGGNGEIQGGTYTSGPTQGEQYMNGQQYGSNSLSSQQNGNNRPYISSQYSNNRPYINQQYVNSRLFSRFRPSSISSNTVNRTSTRQRRLSRYKALPLHKRSRSKDVDEMKSRSYLNN